MTVKLIRDHAAEIAASEATVNRELLQQIGEATPDLIYAKDRLSRMTFANRAVLGFLGKRWEQIRGRSDLDWHHDPEEARCFVENDARIMRDGVTESIEETLTGPDGTVIFLSTKTPLRDASGRVIGISGISTNITARKHDEAQRQLMLEEMNHRVKNTYATVLAMARQTLQSQSDDDGGFAAFEARLLALARANDMLVGAGWAGADIRDLVAAALSLHGDNGDARIACSGPAAALDARNALAVALTLHELGTNAVKYGALSVPTGELTIDWRVNGCPNGRMLELTWRESGGPVVAPVRSQGFGSRLIQHALGRQGGNAVRIDYAATGVECRLQVGLSDAGAESLKVPAPKAASLKAADGPRPEKTSVRGR